MGTKQPHASCLLTEKALHRIDASRMIQRPAAAMGLTVRMNYQMFRATGIPASMDVGGTLEHAQRMAAYERPRTTKLYDRTAYGQKTHAASPS